MFIGTLKFEAIIPGSTSLKDKRKIIQSIQNKIKSKFNVSIAEVDYQDKWQRTTIGVCFVNSGKKEIEEICEKIKNIIFDCGDILIIDQMSEIISIAKEEDGYKI